MPLAMAAPGETRTIIDFTGDEKTKRHLSDMGFIPGGKVSVVGETSSGLILEVKGVRVALDRGLAHMITVA